MAPGPIQQQRISFMLLMTVGANKDIETPSKFDRFFFSFFSTLFFFLSSKTQQILRESANKNNETMRLCSKTIKNTKGVVNYVFNIGRRNLYLDKKISILRYELSLRKGYRKEVHPFDVFILIREAYYLSEEVTHPPTHKHTHSLSLQDPYNRCLKTS